jgi:hypothetical protein
MQQAVRKLRLTPQNFPINIPLEEVTTKPSLKVFNNMSSFSLQHEDESSTFASAKFPVKLHQLLEAAENDHWLSSIISWARDGNGFLIHNHAVFEKQVLPGVFPAMKGFSSLRRQLNLYGIRKGTPGGKLSRPWNEITRRGIQTYHTSSYSDVRSILAPIAETS